MKRRRNLDHQVWTHRCDHVSRAHQDFAFQAFHVHLNQAYLVLTLVPPDIIERRHLDRLAGSPGFLAQGRFTDISAVMHEQLRGPRLVGYRFVHHYHLPRAVDGHVVSKLTKGRRPRLDRDNRHRATRPTGHHHRVITDVRADIPKGPVPGQLLENGAHFVGQPQAAGPLEVVRPIEAEGRPVVSHLVLVVGGKGRGRGRQRRHELMGGGGSHPTSALLQQGPSDGRPGETMNNRFDERLHSSSPLPARPGRRSDSNALPENSGSCKRNCPRAMTIVSLPPPKNMRAEHRSLFEPYIYSADEPRAYDADDVIVTRSGVLFRGLRILPGSFPPYRHLTGRMRTIAYGSRLKRSVEALPTTDRHLIVHNVWSNGFYHWMTESLVKLESLRESYQDYHLLLPSHTSLSQVMAESAGYLGFDKVTWFPKNANLRVPRARFCENTLRQGHYHPERLKRVRQLIIDNAEVVAAPQDRIYVSRAGASRRRIVNEADVETLVAKHGFRTVRMEALSFKEQVQTMAGAQAVISIHGAGLTNTMFMAPGGKILELYKEYYPKQDVTALTRTHGPSICYRRLAAVMDLDYYIQFCRPTDTAAPVDVADLEVDLEALAQNLSAMTA